MTANLHDIYSSALKLLASLTPEGSYSIIIEEAKNLVAAESGSLFLVDQQGKLQRVHSTVPVEFQFSPRPNGFTYKCLKKQEPMVVPAPKVKKHHSDFFNDQVKAVIMIPLAFDNAAIGVLTLDSYVKSHITENELNVIKLFGSFASLKIRNMKLLVDMKKALETRDLFISMASHELKTPLTTISAYTQLIDKSAQEGKSIKPSWSRTLLSATSRMTRLINELLHVNQIRTGKMPYQFEATNLKQTVAIALKDFSISYPMHKAILIDETSSEDKVFIDDERMIQVFINILNNAAKFTEPEKPIKVILSESKQKLSVRFKDQGKGIAQEHMDKIFSEFYKASESSDEGLGLGLYISKKILDVHKATISIKSEVGKGTVVKISLPKIPTES